MTNASGWRVGSFAGAAIIIDPTILLLAAYILGTSALEGGGDNFIGSAIFLGALIVAVLLHEFGHAGIAAMLRIPSKQIVLTFFGGYVEFERPPKLRWHEIAVAAAGPLVNLATAALLWFGAQWLPGSIFFEHLFRVSILLGLFNLLPGYPLDGGTILRAALSYLMTPARARIVAGWLGLLIALALAAFATVFQLWWSLAIGLLLAMNAWAEIRRANAAQRG